MNDSNLLPVLLEINGKMGLIEGKLDGYQSAQRDLKNKLNSLDDRMEKVEKNDMKRIGFLAGISAAVSLAISYFSNNGVS